MEWPARLRMISYDRYLNSLLLPPELRGPYAILAAWQHELAKIRRQVSDPMLGYIRYQWWQDAIGELEHGRITPTHEVLDALVPVYTSHALDPALLHAIVTGYEQEMDAGQPADWEALKHQQRHTSGLLYQLLLSLIVKTPSLEEKEAATLVGEINGLFHLLRSLPDDMKQGQCFIPADTARADELMGDMPQPQLIEKSIQTYVDRLLHEVEAAEIKVKRLSPLARRLLLPSLVLVKAYALRIRKRGYVVAYASLQRPSVGTMLRLWLT